MRWQELTVRDAARLAALEQVLFAGESPWSARELAAEIGAAHTYYLGCWLEDGLVGYAGLGCLGTASAPEYEVHTVGVDPGCQGRGLGRGLIRRLLAVADERPGPVFLEVRCDNAPAVGLYESLGFARLGVRRGYYQPSGADAWTMRRLPRK
ncbi:alanine acetyltransferase [Corynebacterium atypicum]|uniref:[Ribosomal protein bS18]-alanine N-acetyltransferase n=1 Tax=Corynebacterium atypicum TaxID=191610 RepID=A0ABM5QLS7_9CORY|nr:alanine acetyltransferase [Corynebacterium atypicum]